MTTRRALQHLGFEISGTDAEFLSQSQTIYRGTAPAEPVFNFTDAWTTTAVLWQLGERKLGRWLICVEPDTGNVVQTFEIPGNV